MNFDVNMLNGLMRMMNENTNSNTNTNLSTDTGQSYSHNSANENNRNVSAFASENGIGEKVDFDGQNNRQYENKNANILSMLKSFAPNNPLLQMLGGMGGMSGGLSGNSNGSNMDISQMLPLIMSMMTSKGSNVKSKKEDDNKDKKGNNGDDAKDKNNNKDIRENARVDDNCQEKTKTQQGLFKPVAFAGYDVICALCKLILFCKSDS